MASIIDHNWVNTLVLLGAVQGIILTAVIWQKKSKNKHAVYFLTGLLAITSVLLIGKRLFELGSMSRFLLVVMIYTDAILLIFGPLIYLFIRSLLRRPLPPRREMIWHFLPSFFQLTVFNAIIALTWLEVYPVVPFDKIDDLYYGLEIAAMLSFGLYTYYSYKLYLQYEAAFFEKFSVPQLPSFLKAVFTIFAVLLVSWMIGFVLKLTQRFADNQEFLYYAFWISVTVFVYVITYKILLVPQLLDLPTVRLKPNTSSGLDEALKVRLQHYMKQERPYLNPQLSLDDLATALGTTRHELSKVINHGFGKNFFDFINTFRVNAFIDTYRQNGATEKKTFLEVAYEVGFNSKSAFNRAFRKETEHSPSEYLK